MESVYIHTKLKTIGQPGEITSKYYFIKTLGERIYSFKFENYWTTGGNYF